MAHNSTPDDLSEKFKALGDHTRFALVQQLMNNQGACVSELADSINISIAGVSQQLKVLENVGIIKRVRSGQKICYELNREDKESSQLLQLLESTG